MCRTLARFKFGGQFPVLTRAYVRMIPVHVVLFLSLVLLSGCLTTGNEPGSNLQAFTATYRYEDGDVVHYSLSGVGSVLGWDDEMHDGYVLEKKSAGVTAHDWLDERLRLVREDLPCTASFAQTGCVKSFILWDLAGAPHPLGLGLADTPREPELYLLNGVSYLPKVWANDTARGTTYTMVFEHEGRQVLRAVYLFDGRPVAKEVIYETANRDLRMQLQTYAEGSALPEIAPWPPQRPIEMPERQGALFNGEDEDTFGVGYSHAELLRLIRADEPGIDTPLQDGGCVVKYSMAPFDDAAAALALERDVAAIELHVLSTDGTRSVWDIAVYEGPVRMRIDAWKEDEGPSDLECARDILPYWSPVSLQETVDRAHERIRSHEGISGILYEVGFPYLHRLPVPGDAARFQISFVPPGANPNAGYSPYAANYVPSLDAWKFFVLHPDDQARL